MDVHIGRYEIRGELGRGGFGKVHRAFDPVMGRMAAIKVLTAGSEQDLLVRFRNEAAAAGKLRHKNIVTVYDFGEQDGTPYIVMELLEGQDLHHVITGRMPLTLRDKVRIISEMADGLHHAHKHGIVHRDVKPANVMLLQDGSVKIMDFGIALLTQTTAQRLTPQGSIIGTFRYMAPEQFSGTPADAASDIFAYGLICYELLTGRHPFDAGEPAGLMYNIMQMQPEPPSALCPECPPALDEVVLRLLAKDRDLRYASLEDTLFDLQPVLRDLGKQQAAELLVRALERLEAQDLETAQTLVREALELDPLNAEARRVRESVQQGIQRRIVRPKLEALVRAGEEDLAARRFDSAIERFQSALRLDRSNTELQSLMGQAREAAGRAQRAEQRVAEAGAALDQNALDTALQYAQEALAEDPGHPGAQAVLAEVREQIEARERERRLAEVIQRAKALLILESYDDAISLLRAAQTEYHESRQVHALLQRAEEGKADYERRQRLTGQIENARELIRAVRFPEAVAALEMSLAEFPDSGENSELLDYAREQLRIQREKEAVERISAENARLIEAKQFEAAIEAIGRAIEAHPRASALSDLLERARAEKAAHERLQARDHAVHAAEAYRSARQFEDARRELDAYSAAYGADDRVDRLRARVTAEWDEHKKSEAVWRTIEQAQALLDQGQTALATRILRQARADYPAAQEIAPVLAQAEAKLAEEERAADVSAVIAEAGAAAEEGRYEDVVRVMEEAARRYPDDRRVAAARDAAKRAKAAWDAELARQREQQRREAEIAAAGTAAARAVEGGRFQEAIEILDRPALRLPPDPRIEQLLQIALAGRDREQRAAEIRDALARSRSAMARREFDEALETLDAAIRRHPDAGELRAAQEEAAAGRASWERTRAHDAALERISQLRSRESFNDALRTIGEAERQFGADAEFGRLRAEIEAEIAARYRIEQAIKESRRLSDAGWLDEAVSLLQEISADLPDNTALASALAGVRVRIARRDEEGNRRRLLDEIAEIERAAAAADDAVSLDLHRTRLAAVNASDPGIREARTRTERVISRRREELRTAEERSATLTDLTAITEEVHGAADTSALDALARRGRRTAGRNPDPAIREAAAALNNAIAARREALRPGEPARRKPSVNPRPFIGAAGGLAAAALVILLIQRSQRPHTVSLEVRTQPPGASVVVGNQRCVTPDCRLSVPPGKYQIQARLEGYKAVDLPLVVEPGRRGALAPIDIQLEANPAIQAPVTHEESLGAGSAQGRLAVRAGERDAAVFIDDKPAGRTGPQGTFEIALSPGSYDVRVEKNGCAPAHPMRVDLKPDRRLEVSFELHLLPAVLSVRGGPPGVQIRLSNGAPLGTIDAGGALSANVPAGDQTLEISKDGYTPRSLSKRFAPGQTVGLAPGDLSLSPIPPADQQEWEKVRNSQQAAALEDYRRRFPQSAHAGEAEARIQDLAWQALNRNDAAAVRAFAEKYPRGTHVREAIARAAQLDWDALNKNDVNALRDFSRRYPDGDYHARAEQQIGLLQKAEQSRQDQLNADRNRAAQLAADRQAIFAAVARYVAAIGHRNVGELQAAFPGIPAPILSTLRRLFSDRDYKVSIELTPKAEPHITGDSATMDCDQSTVTIYRGQRDVNRRVVRMSFARHGSGWAIEGLQETR